MDQKKIALQMKGEGPAVGDAPDIGDIGIHRSDDAGEFLKWTVYAVICQDERIELRNIRYQGNTFLVGAEIIADVAPPHDDRTKGIKRSTASASSFGELLTKMILKPFSTSLVN